MFDIRADCSQGFVGINYVTSWRGSAAMKSVFRTFSLVSLAAAAALLAACGASSSGGGSGAVAPKSVEAAPPASGCGSYEASLPKDPDGLVAALPPKLKALYKGYPTPIRKSVWSGWKPKHDPPYHVGIQWAQVNNDFQRNVTETLKADLEKDPDVGKVTFQSTGNNIDVVAELQQLESLIRSKPDIIVLQELQPKAFVSSINKAGKAGIPVIVAIDSIPETKYAVNLQYNTFNAPASVASMTVRQMGGKGNVLMAHAIPGIGVDTEAFRGFDAILKNCPNIKKAEGAVYGNFVNAIGKSETLKYLATHPEKIDGVLSTAAITSGMMSAFEQTGRPVPPIADTGASKASLAFWRDNFDSYRGSAGIVPEVNIGSSLAGVVKRMLTGNGVEFSDIVGDIPLVTDSNLDDWVEDSWTFQTPGDPPGPTGFLTESDLDQFFRSSKAGE